MDFLKELFENGELSFDAFVAAVNAKGYKLADLSTGNYVSKGKYEDELRQKDATITDLQDQITQRDTDLTNLQNQLNTEGTDNKTKVTTLTNQLSTLQSQYEADKSNYETRLSKQAYEFAVREFANSKQFTSNAAKRDFINEMIQKNLTMENNKIMGAEDFVTIYTEANPDAFVVESQDPTPKPTFVIPPTNPTPAPESNAFSNLFGFAGVRPHESK